jgi:hypothetical protein
LPENHPIQYPPPKKKQDPINQSTSQTKNQNQTTNQPTQNNKSTNHNLRIFSYQLMPFNVLITGKSR